MCLFKRRRPSTEPVEGRGACRSDSPSNNDPSQIARPQIEPEPGSSEHRRVTFNVEGLKVAYTGQLVRLQLYLDLRTVLCTPETEVAFFRQLDLLREELKLSARHLILAGRAPACWQLPPELRPFYQGLPDDYSAEMAWGRTLQQRPVKVKLGDTSFSAVALAETGMRKMAAIATHKGGGRFGPAPGREADLYDCFLILYALQGAAKANAWATGQMGDLASMDRELYKSMRSAGLFTSVPREQVD